MIAFDVVEGQVYIPYSQGNLEKTQPQSAQDTEGGLCARALYEFRAGKY